MAQICQDMESPDDPWEADTKRRNLLLLAYVMEHHDAILMHNWVRAYGGKLPFVTKPPTGSEQSDE